MIQHVLVIKIFWMMIKQLSKVIDRCQFQPRKFYGNQKFKEMLVSDTKEDVYWFQIAVVLRRVRINYPEVYMYIYPLVMSITMFVVYIISIHFQKCITKISIILITLLIQPFTTFKLSLKFLNVFH